jgi:hypothetical protein
MQRCTIFIRVLVASNKLLKRVNGFWPVARDCLFFSHFVGRAVDVQYFWEAISDALDHQGLASLPLPFRASRVFRVGCDSCVSVATTFAVEVYRRIARIVRGGRSSGHCVESSSSSPTLARLPSHRNSRATSAADHGPR